MKHTRRNTARIVPLLNYIPSKGTVYRYALLEDEDSPVNDVHVSQLNRLLKRMLENKYITEVKTNVYSTNS